MLRLKPSVISLTVAEVKDAETRRRFRRHLQRANAQQSHEQEQTEQNRETLPPRRSSSTSSLRAENEPDPAVGQGSRRVLGSSPSHSRIVHVPHAVTAPPLALPHDSDRHVTDDQEPKAAHEPPASVPRLLAMTPRRFAHALQSASAQRSGVAPGRPADTAGLPITTYTTRLRREDTSGGGTQDTGSADRTEAPTLPPRDRTSPRLPPPFSQTPRGVTAGYNAPPSADVSDGSESGKETAETSDLRRVPPVTPARRSSLSAASGRQAIEDTRGKTSPTSAAEPTVGPGRTRTRSAVRFRTSTGIADNAPGTPEGSNGIGEADAARQSPSSRMSRLRIYNDSLPRSTQPETPQHLPEARHQSRLHGSYTVPARRDSPVQSLAPASSRRWRRYSRRSPSPAGLQTPGFLGLYGGIENGDDTALFEQAGRDHGFRNPRMEQSSSHGS